jgi:hypothetical protein
LIAIAIEVAKRSELKRRGSYFRFAVFVTKANQVLIEPWEDMTGFKKLLEDLFGDLDPTVRVLLSKIAVGLLVKYVEYCYHA